MQVLCASVLRASSFFYTRKFYRIAAGAKRNKEPALALASITSATPATDGAGAKRT